LQTDLGSGHPEMPVELRLFPGLAEPSSTEPWKVRVAVRFYSDSVQKLADGAELKTDATVAPSETKTVKLEMPRAPWPLTANYHLLGLFVADVKGQRYTREFGLDTEAAR
jgi:hypothetical protein